MKTLLLFLVLITPAFAEESYKKYECAGCCKCDCGYEVNIYRGEEMSFFDSPRERFPIVFDGKTFSGMSHHVGQCWGKIEGDFLSTNCLSDSFGNKCGVAVYKFKENTSLNPVIEQ